MKKFAGANTDDVATPAPSDDPYAAMSAKYPVLRGLTKETLGNYTSLMVAYHRARESKREDAILNDPFAAALAGEAMDAFFSIFPSVLENAETVGYVLVRCRVMDDAISEDVDASIQQVVYLGAGMDSRPYRLPRFQDCHVFELDGNKQLMDQKQQVLEEAGATLLAKQRDVIITNLADYEWPELLEKHGFDASKPTLWIAEGLLIYMPTEAIDRLLHKVDELSAPKSQMLVDFCGTGSMDFQLSTSNGKDVEMHVNTMSENMGGGPLRALPWSKHYLVARTAEAEYGGPRWDPVLFHRYHIPKQDAYFGPYFSALCTKEEEAPN